jgi:hypothetical protein
MTTQAEVKRLIKPLLDRHPDFILVGRWLYLRPIHHFARAILIDRTSNPNLFNPRWAVMHLFQWRRSFHLNWSEFLDNVASRRPAIWDKSDPNLASTMIDQTESVVLPKLRAIQTLNDYLAYVSQHYLRHHLFDRPDVRLIVESALGNWDSARSICEEHLDGQFRDNPLHDDDGRATYQRIRALCACVTEGDSQGAAKLLHAWEAATAKNLKIEHIWEPTPFPFERRSVQ